MSHNPQLIYLPISYFGPISYYSIILQHVCQIEHHENYQKRSIRNRTQILSANGPISLSIPLKKGKTNLPISQVEIAYEENWANNHIRSIISAYGTAPYFDFYIDQIEGLINSKTQSLLEFNMSIHTFLIKILGIDNTLITSQYDNSEHIVRPIFIGKKKTIESESPKYLQVFTDRFEFTPDMSILDLIFNVGPESKSILQATTLSFH